MRRKVYLVYCLLGNKYFYYLKQTISLVAKLTRVAKNEKISKIMVRESTYKLKKMENN